MNKIIDKSSEFQIFKKKDYTKEYYIKNKDKIKKAARLSQERSKLKKEQKKRDNDLINMFLGVK